MLRSMNTAASGMEAQELKVDLIAHNLANVNTTGFKKARAEFQDLLYESVKTVSGKDGEAAPVGLEVGQGVRASATLREFTPGALRQTGQTLDVAIEGAGFLQVRRPNGQLGYTRDGSLKMDAGGRLVTSDGNPIEPAITLPDRAQKIAIAADGTVSAIVGESTDPVDLGRVQLADFANASGLVPLGHNMFEASASAGPAIVGNAGTEGFGTLSQGYLEASNVKVVEEMIELIATQRAYETSSRVIQAADEMLRTTAQLR
ncbi:MAG: flagellar basal-body rod protein FlgG [Deltaproteobacteria bacterium]|nr:flagellar basal-body rod protein FlgG [Deltaproteobacteria bacterium]